MLFDGIETPVSRRLWWFQRELYFRSKQAAWVDAQEEGVMRLTTADCNNDQPCKYARSRGE